VTDNTGYKLGGVSISLLHPSDSTLAHFGISNMEGKFEVKNANDGSYLLQIAASGYTTLYRPLHLSDTSNTNLGTLVLEVSSQLEHSTELDSVVVTGDKVPVRVKGDTLEYN